MRSFLLFFCSILSLVIAGYLGYSVFFGTPFDGEEKTNASISYRFVLALKQHFEAGDIVSEADVIWIKMRQENLLPNTITQEVFEQQGHTYFSLNEAKKPGLALTGEQIVWPDDVSYLAKTLQAGYRAISVSFEAKDGILSILRAGNRLDVIHVIASKGGANEYSSPRPSVIASNVRVLQAESTNGEEGRGRARRKGHSIRNAILEVRLSQVKAISRAQLSGVLIAALRTTNDKSIISDPETILSNFPQKKLSAAQTIGFTAKEDLKRGERTEIREVFIQRGSTQTTETRESHRNLRAVIKIAEGLLN